MTVIRLFTLNGAQRQDPAVALWFASIPSELSLLAKQWFAELRACGPDVLELLHDGHPTACVQDLAFGDVNVFQTHANLGFFFGARLNDPAGLLQGSGRYMRHVKLRPEAPIDERALRELIATAYADIRAVLAAR